MSDISDNTLKIEQHYKSQFHNFEAIADALMNQRLVDEALGTKEHIPFSAGAALDSFCLNETLNLFDVCSKEAYQPVFKSAELPWSLQDFWPRSISNFLHLRASSFETILMNFATLEPGKKFDFGHQWSNPLYQRLGDVRRSLLGEGKAFILGELYNILQPHKRLKRSYMKAKLAFHHHCAKLQARVENGPRLNVPLRTKFKALLKVSLRETFGEQSADAMASFICLCYPVVLFEDRLRRFLEAKQFFERWQAAGFVTFNFWFSDIDTFFVAAAKALAKPVIIGQHGGYYGYRYNHGFATLEYAVADQFLTWGWDRSSIPSDEKVAKSFVPTGSFYFRALRERYEVKGEFKPGISANFKSRGLRSILYLPTDYLLRKPRRYDLPFLNWQFVGPAVEQGFETLFFLAKKHGFTVHVKDFKRGGFLHDSLHKAAKLNAMDFELIDPAQQTLSLFKSYDLILWDTVGTGFLETNAIAKPTLLLPSAKYLPTFNTDTYPVSELFFLDRKSPEDLGSVFEAAQRATWPFFEKFASPATLSLDSYLLGEKSLMQTANANLSSARL